MLSWNKNHKYYNLMFIEFSKGMILPKKDKVTSSKPSMFKESIQSVHNPENVSFEMYIRLVYFSFV